MWLVLLDFGDFGPEQTVQVRHKNAVTSISAGMSAYRVHLKLSLAKLLVATYSHSCASRCLTMAPPTAPQTCPRLLRHQIVFSAAGRDKMTQTTDVKASRPESGSLVRSSSSVGLAFKPTQMSCTGGLIAPGLV